eukprot:CAMPEP_0173428414 /NCGR_PEP_ID=MMETSP1357-20121228/7357_1 /TAXON_ID=77926 /ORGANISM="Hemiselmis rufescens, Strain PCC563" /LENGTH=71 /DNA_ID=CAMNT_0014392411 /DNA_START=57 /DNA_END=272 /DNA_ORIENTATION=+
MFETLHRYRVAVQELWHSDEHWKKVALNFCTSHYRTDMEATHCVDKLLSGNVILDDDLSGASPTPPAPASE